MAKRISALNPDTSLTTADYMPIVQASGPTTLKTTLATLISFFFGNIPAGTVTNAALAGSITTDKLTNPYKAKASKITSNQTISSSYTPALVTLTSEAYDLNSNYDTSTSKYTVPVTGYYLVSGSVRFQCASAGECGMAIYNCALGWFRTPMATSEYIVMSASGLAKLTAGQEVYLTVYAQNGGTVYKDFPDQTYLSIHLLSV